jgi:hypothetical protein
MHEPRAAIREAAAEAVDTLADALPPEVGGGDWNNLKKMGLRSWGWVGDPPRMHEPRVAIREAAAEAVDALADAIPPEVGGGRWNRLKKMGLRSWGWVGDPPRMHERRIAVGEAAAEAVGAVADALPSEANMGRVE